MKTTYYQQFQNRKCRGIFILNKKEIKGELKIILNGNFYDLYLNRLKEMFIVFRGIKFNLWNVGRENVYVRREGSSI